ncbi:MAG: hypothetical protein COW30_10480 [Rhodospirillales bacterium CG15_BIG_FIL_POST_REV_8_21_14_020_66_15]|nr:MAG: hypothetical protein COW30_10480 [Rhodospirillales bacterium CG15_BIG_FIL_POST_REV_8_21_14_020_66_15]
MDALSLMVVISIGNVVAWVVAIYTRNGVHALLKNVVLCSTGAIAASWLAAALIPEFQAVGMILSAFAGAVAALFLRHPTPAP